MAQYEIKILVSVEEDLTGEQRDCLLGEMLAQCEANEDHPEVRAFFSEIRFTR